MSEKYKYTEDLIKQLTAKGYAKVQRGEMTMEQFIQGNVNTAIEFRKERGMDYTDLVK